MSPNKAMQEFKSVEEACETSTNSKTFAFNKYKKINNTFPNTVKFLSKILSEKGIEDSSLQKYIITYLSMESLFELKGYRSKQGFFLFTTGHQIVLMTKKELTAHMDDLLGTCMVSFSFRPNVIRGFDETLPNLVNNMLCAMETKIGLKMISGGNYPEDRFKRVMAYDMHDHIRFLDKLIPFRIYPTNRFTLDIDRSNYIILEEDFHSTYKSSALNEYCVKHDWPLYVLGALVVFYIFYINFFENSSIKYDLTIMV